MATIEEIADQHGGLETAEQYQCDCCGQMYPLDQLTFVSHGALGNSAGCDTTICQQCQAKARQEGGWK